MNTYSAQYGDLFLIVHAPTITEALAMAAKRKPEGAVIRKIQRVKKG